MINRLGVASRPALDVEQSAALGILRHDIVHVQGDIRNQIRPRAGPLQHGLRHRISTPDRHPRIDEGRLGSERGLRKHQAAVARACMRQHPRAKRGVVGIDSDVPAAREHQHTTESAEEIAEIFTITGDHGLLDAAVTAPNIDAALAQESFASIRDEPVA